jgi:pyruvyltransferase
VRSPALAYDSRTRRRARVLRRLLRASAKPSNYPMAPVVAAFWWDGHANFGDALTPWLLERYGLVPVLAEPRRARLVGVGSILEQLPPDYAGTIWGSGLLYGRPLELPDATVLALRGRLTKERLGARGDIALGDPGILVARHIGRPEARWTLGVVPHGVHAGSAVVRDLAARYPREVRVLDTRDSPDRVLRGIAECSAVVSTSLHGLIAADALGIPAAWTELEPALWGADFKFRDHESVVSPGRSRRVGLGTGERLGEVLSRLSTADEDRVEESVLALEDALRRVPTVGSVPFLALRRR